MGSCVEIVGRFGIFAKRKQVAWGANWRRCKIQDDLSVYKIGLLTRNGLSGGVAIVASCHVAARILAWFFYSAGSCYGFGFLFVVLNCGQGGYGGELGE